MRSPKREDAATSVEYSLIAAAIAGLVALAVVGLGGAVEQNFCSTAAALESTSTITSPC